MKAALERDCEPNEVMDPEKEVQKLKEEKGTNPYLQKNKDSETPMFYSLSFSIGVPWALWRCPN